MLTFHVRCVTIADISPTRPQAKMSKKQRPRRFNGALFHGLPLLVGVEQSLTGSGYEVGPDGGDPSVPSIQDEKKQATATQVRVLRRPPAPSAQLQGRQLSLLSIARLRYGKVAKCRQLSPRRRPGCVGACRLAASQSFRGASYETVRTSKDADGGFGPYTAALRVLNAPRTHVSKSQLKIVSSLPEPLQI